LINAYSLVLQAPSSSHTTLRRGFTPNNLQVGTSNIQDSESYYPLRDDLVQHLWNKKISTSIDFFLNYYSNYYCSIVFLGHLLYFGDHLIINPTCIRFDILDIFLLHTMCLSNTCAVNWIASFGCFFYYYLDCKLGCAI
jgi:hypothetical protein